MNHFDNYLASITVGQSVWLNARQFDMNPNDFHSFASDILLNERPGFVFGDSYYAVISGKRQIVVFKGTRVS